MVGIAFDVHDLRDRILGLVADRVDDDAATDGTIRTGAARFAGSGDLEGRGLGVNRSQVKAEGGESGAAEDGAFEKSPARELHFVAPRHCAYAESCGGEWLRTPTPASSVYFANAKNYTPGLARSSIQGNPCGVMLLVLVSTERARVSIPD